MQTNEEIKKEWEESSMSKYYGACFECCDFEKMMNEIADWWLQKLADREKEIVEGLSKLVNPYEDWDEKTGKTREREKHLYHGFEEAKDTVLKIITNKK